MHKKTRSFETQITCLSLFSSVPLLLFLLWIMVYAGISIWLILLTALLGSLILFYSHYRIYQNTAYQFRSLSTVVDGLKQGEYSLRARSVEGTNASRELIDSINEQANDLSQLRWQSVESQHLLHTVIEHIDVAIVALSDDNQIRFFNPAAKKLLHLEQGHSNSTLVKQLAFVQSFTSGCHQVLELSLGQQQGRFNVHVEEFREAGLPHKLLFITNVSTLLRREERKAWQSLVRVISHEINNSLAPIASISQTLTRLIARKHSSNENDKDLKEGLSIINTRALGLSRFVDSYKQLAKLPEPKRKKISIRSLIDNIQLLFKNQCIVVASETDVEVYIDPDQFEQVLINLLKNSVEAMAQTNPNGVIRVEWLVTENFFKLIICDQGGGISNPDNLFVPFYSTKKQGSGIGLVLCRQIVEAHNGRLSINNQNAISKQKEFSGCRACIEIPFDFSREAEW